MIDKKNIIYFIYLFLKYFEPIVIEMTVGFLIFLFPEMITSDLFYYEEKTTEIDNVWKSLFGLMLFLYGGFHLCVNLMYVTKKKDKEIRLFTFIQKCFITGEICIMIFLSILAASSGQKKVNPSAYTFMYTTLISAIGLRVFFINNIDCI
jgi:hypothetical protein